MPVPRFDWQIVNNMKRWTYIAIINIVLFVILTAAVNIKKNVLYDENAASRWSQEDPYSQLTVIYPASGMEINDYTFGALQHSIIGKLEQTAYSTQNNPDSISVDGVVTVVSDKATVTINCLGVENDFFIFHPVDMISGSYFMKDDLMKDGIILDEESAWKLFGSNDIEGMTVTIKGVPHIVRGVVNKADDRVSRAAGLEKDMCYISLSSLKEYGTVTGSYTYEVILPNPVENFAYTQISEALGNDTLDKVILIENTIRYRSDRLRDTIKDFGIRSMSSGGYIFPYFENVARAYEDYFALIYLVRMVLIIEPVIIAGIYIYRFAKSDMYKKVKETRKKLWEDVKEYLRLHLPF